MKINKPLSAALAAAGLGYAIGNLNPAYVMGLRKGYDIRKKGSGNAGATNLMILEGKKAGAFVMCFDISKAAVSVGLARKLFLQSKYAGEAAGAACVLGHMYPALMHFRGGKGLACLGGVILAFGVHDFLTTLFLETVVLLSKGEIDSKKVRVEFSLEDMDMSGFQKGATYEQIKAYVLEHTGLKVSSLYISQIKRKCGLDVGQNYNLSKKEDAKVPKCPPEKEAAIRDALKYFQMI